MLRSSKTQVKDAFDRTKTNKINEDEARAIMNDFNDEMSLMSIPR